VLYTVSSCNLKTGQPITSDQLSSISHFPHERVENCCDYLSEIGIVTRRNTSYRIIHDVLADYILRSDLIRTKADLKESVDFLIANFNKAKENFIKPTPAYSLIDFRGLS